MNVYEQLLLISVYMPCRWITDNYTEFKDTLDQLSVILSQYAPTHQIVIGGDLNEDITLTANGARAQYLREFVEEHELKTQPTKPTFINPAGAQVSTIDYYFLYSHTLSDSTCITSLRRLDIVITNVSDHYPIELTFEVSLDKQVVAADKCIPTQTRVNLKKVDQDLYAALVKQRLLQIETNANTVYDLEKAVTSVNHVLTKCTDDAAPRQ